MSERPTPETDAEVTTFTSISKLKRRFEASTGKVSADFARRLERERDELQGQNKKLLEEVNDLIRQRPLLVEDFKSERDEARERAKELAELVDGAYILVELHKPECKYNEKWRGVWLQKAKRLIPGVDSIWY